MSEIIENELYERDEATNAFVPVITLASALEAGDKVAIKGNQLYKVDELTNAQIPVVTGDLGGGSVMMTVPDYANMESTNRITGGNWNSQSGYNSYVSNTWIADRTGYVFLKLNFSFSVSASTANWGSIIFVISNVVVSGTGTHYFVYYNTGVFPVKAGDGVIMIAETNTSGTVRSIECKYIPPKFIKV
jgi:hypothetical protein